MKKRSVILIASILLLTIVLSGCFGGGNKQIDEIDKSTRLVTYTETLKGKNYTNAELEYIKDSVLYKVNFDVNMKKGLIWLKANSKPSDKVLTWWDNGHMVRGFARREPIMYTPSYELLKTTRTGKWDEAKLGAFANNDDAVNVAYALLADSPAVAQGIMKRYGAKWLLVTKADTQKIEGMAVLIGDDYTTYLDDLGQPKDAVIQKVVFKAADNWPLKGFENPYHDDYINIYKLVG